MSPPIVALLQLSVRVEGRWLLKKISCQLYPGRLLTLIGPNGAGKSTLARVILGLLPHQEGQLVRQPGLRVGYVPQKLDPAAVLPLSAGRFLKLHPYFSEKKARDALELAHFPEVLLDRPYRALSGGELQKLLLARALLNLPQLLVLDEPTRGLDVAGQRAMYRLIATIQAQTHCSVLLISHDLHFVMATTDHVLCLNQTICCEGTPEALQSDPHFMRLFGAEGGIAPYQHHH